MTSDIGKAKPVRLLLSLLMLSTWSLACTPLPPNKAQSKAQVALAKAEISNHAACRFLSSENCTFYNATPQKVMTWLKDVEPFTNSTQMGQQWRMSYPTEWGIVATIQALDGGTLVKRIDKTTDYERLTEKLSEVVHGGNVGKTKMPNGSIAYEIGIVKPSPSATCQTMKLTDTSYKITDCKWNSKDSTVTLKIESSKDHSLTTGKWLWDTVGCGPVKGLQKINEDKI